MHKSEGDRPNSTKNGMRNVRTSNGSKIARMVSIFVILGLMKIANRLKRVLPKFSAGPSFVQGVIY